MNLLFLISVFFISSSEASLKAQWLGVAGISISDGKTTVLLDPTFTKPSLKHWVFGSEFKSDRSRVQKNLDSAKLKKADAVFASHTHFDHAVDIATVSTLTGATVYGGESLERVVKFQNPAASFTKIKDRSQIKVGDFKITVFLRRHAPILQSIGWEFLPDAVPTDFSAKFYQYYAGETWATVIEHPLGNILFDQSPQFFEPIAPFIGKIKFHFVGVSNKKSLDDLVHQNISRVGAKKIIPLHFDFFFLQSDFLESLTLPSAEFSRIQESLNGKQEFMIPKRNEIIEL